MTKKSQGKPNGDAGDGKRGGSTRGNNPRVSKGAKTPQGKDDVTVSRKNSVEKKGVTERKQKPAAKKPIAAERTSAKAPKSPALQANHSFSPTVGDLDLHLFGEGRHELIYEKLGAHLITHEGEKGVSFAVWAPGAQKVSVVGNFNAWDGSQHPMHPRGNSGVWETFIPKLGSGELYKYEIKATGLPVFLKADPYAFYAEVPPDTSSIIYESKYRFRDSHWL